MTKGVFVIRSEVVPLGNGVAAPRGRRESLLAAGTEDCPGDVIQEESGGHEIL